MRISDWSSDVCSSDLQQGLCTNSKGRPPMRYQLAILLLILSGVAAAREVPIKDFFKDAEFESVLLSPDGEHIAVTMPRDDRSVLVVLKVDDKSVDRKSTRLNSSH